MGPHDALLVGWIVGIVAIAGPTWQREPSPFAEQPPAMIVLKVAPSMTTPDLAPTRLDRARQKIADLLKARDGMPAGLIAYSGSAHLVLPPTPDRDVVVGMAEALSPNVMPREGDRLADAVALAAKVLRDGGQGGSIVVVADTVAPGQAEALRQAAPGVPVTFYAMAPAPAVEADGNLAAAVTALDARLVPAAVDNADVQDVARRLPCQRAGRTVAGEAERWQEAGYWLTPLFALIALCGSAAAGCSRHDAASTLRASHPGSQGSRRRTVVALGVATWTVGWSDLWSTPDQRGRRLMEDRRYAEAAAAFRRSDVARHRAVPRRRLQGGSAAIRRPGHRRGRLRPGHGAGHAGQIRRGDRPLRPRASAAAGLAGRRGQPHARPLRAGAPEGRRRPATSARAPTRSSTTRTRTSKDSRPRSPARR